MKFYFNLLFILSINIYCSSFLSKLKGISGKIRTIFKQNNNINNHLQKNIKGQYEKNKLLLNFHKKNLFSNKQFNNLIFNQQYQRSKILIENAKNKKESFKKNATKIREKFKFFIQKSKYYPKIKSLIKKLLNSDKNIDKELIDIFGENFSNREDLKNKLIESILLEKNYDTKYKKLKKKLVIIAFLLIELIALTREYYKEDIPFEEYKTKEEEYKKLLEKEKIKYENLTIFLNLLYKYYNMNIGGLENIDTFYHEMGHAIEFVLYYKKDIINDIKQKELDFIQKERSYIDFLNKTMYENMDIFFEDEPNYNDIYFYNELIEAIALINEKNYQIKLLSPTKYFITIKDKCDGDFKCNMSNNAYYDNIKICLSGVAIQKIIEYYNREKIITSIGMYSKYNDLKISGDINMALFFFKNFFIETIKNKNTTFFDILKREKDDKFVISILEAQSKAKKLETDYFLSLLKINISNKVLNEVLKEIEIEVAEKEKIAEYTSNFMIFMMQKQIEKFKKYEIPIKEMTMKYGPAAIPGYVHFNGIEMTREFIESCRKNNIPIDVSKNLEESYKLIDEMNKNLIEYKLNDENFIKSIEESIKISPVLNNLQKQYLKMTGKDIQNISKRAPSYNDFNSYQNGRNYLIANGQNFYTSNAFQNNKYQINKNFRYSLFDQFKIHNPYLNNKILSK